MSTVTGAGGSTRSASRRVSDPSSGLSNATWVWWGRMLSSTIVSRLRAVQVTVRATSLSGTSAWATVVAAHDGFAPALKQSVPTHGEGDAIEVRDARTTAAANINVKRSLGLRRSRRGERE